MSEINLLPRKQTGSREAQVLITVRYIAIGLMLLVAVTSSSLFLLNIQSPLPKLADEEKQLLASLSAYDKRANTYAALHERLNSISVLLKGRTDYGSYMDLIFKQTPPGVSIDAVTLSDKEEKTLFVTASSKSLLAINTYMDNISKIAKEKKEFKRIALSQAIFDSSTSKYSVTITAEVL